MLFSDKVNFKAVMITEAEREVCNDRPKRNSDPKCVCTYHRMEKYVKHEPIALKEETNP